MHYEVEYEDDKYKNNKCNARKFLLAKRGVIIK